MDWNCTEFGSRCCGSHTRARIRRESVDIPFAICPVPFTDRWTKSGHYDHEFRLSFHSVAANRLFSIVKTFDFIVWWAAGVIGVSNAKKKRIEKHKLTPEANKSWTLCLSQTKSAHTHEFVMCDELRPERPNERMSVWICNLLRIFIFIVPCRGCVLCRNRIKFLVFGFRFLANVLANISVIAAGPCGSMDYIYDAPLSFMHCRWLTGDI